MFFIYNSGEMNTENKYFKHFLAKTIMKVIQAYNLTSIPKRGKRGKNEWKEKKSNFRSKIYFIFLNIILIMSFDTFYFPLYF
jgi:hypothetical protein